MWQAIQSAVESADDHEQRKALVRHGTTGAMREAGVSGVGQPPCCARGGRYLTREY